MRVASRLLIAGICVLTSAPRVGGQGADPLDATQVHVKAALAETMTAGELQAYKERVARSLALRPRAAARRPSNPTAPGDACPPATYELAAWPFVMPGSTLGAADDYDLPADTASPTCTAPTACTGDGPVGSLPRGAIYTGTGTGPDGAYKIRVPADCLMTITATPTSAWDLALIVYEATCSSVLADCVCVDDTGLAGAAESVAVSALAGTDYFVLIDGYSTGATPPGPSGPYTLGITTSGGCILVPVELQGLSIE
jgi:hypothetical protein